MSTETEFVPCKKSLNIIYDAWLKGISARETKAELDAVGIHMTIGAVIDERLYLDEFNAAFNDCLTS